MGPLSRSAAESGTRDEPVDGADATAPFGAAAAADAPVGMTAGSPPEGSVGSVVAAQEHGGPDASSTVAPGDSAVDAVPDGPGVTPVSMVTTTVIPVDLPPPPPSARTTVMAAVPWPPLPEPPRSASPRSGEAARTELAADADVDDVIDLVVLERDAFERDAATRFATLPPPPAPARVTASAAAGSAEPDQAADVAGVVRTTDARDVPGTAWSPTAAATDAAMAPEPAVATEPQAIPPAADTGPVPPLEPAPAGPVPRAGDQDLVEEPPAGVTRPAEPVSAVLVVGADDAPNLPHWTEPAAEPGEVDPGQARWRATEEDWDDSRPLEALDAAGDRPPGALDEQDRQRDEQYLTFADLDVPHADPPKAPPRGTPDDPILLQRTGQVVAPTPDAEGSSPVEAPGPGENGPVDDEPGPAAPAPSGGRNLRQSVQVGLAIASGALAIFLIGALTPLKWFPLVLIVPAIVGSMAELFNASVRAGFKPVNLVGVVAGAALPVVAYAAGSPSQPAGETGMMLVIFLTVAASMAWYLFGVGKGRPVPNIALTVLGVLYVGAMGGYSGLILRAGAWPGSGTTAEQGVAFFILIALGTTMYDVGGYLLGSRLGRTPLSAASPNKTREGLAAGVCCSVATVLVVGGVFGVGVQTVTQALVLACVLALVAPLGDLFESMLKRDLGVKDMGSLIPSHGGLLDRLDAYLFTLPAAYYTLRMLSLL